MGYIQAIVNMICDPKLRSRDEAMICNLIMDSNIEERHDELAAQIRESFVAPEKADAIAHILKEKERCLATI